MTTIISNKEKWRACSPSFSPCTHLSGLFPLYAPSAGPHLRYQQQMKRLAAHLPRCPGDQSWSQPAMLLMSPDFSDGLITWQPHNVREIQSSCNLKTSRKPSGNAAMLNEWTSGGSVHASLVGIVDYHVLTVAVWMDYSSFKDHIHLLVLITYLSLHNYWCSASGADSDVKYLELKIISRLTHNLIGLWHQHNVSFFSGLRVSWEYAQNVLTNERPSSGSLKVCRRSAQITRQSCTTLRCHDSAFIVANTLMLTEVGFIAPRADRANLL